MPRPTEDVRTNRGTWAVPQHALPALGSFMHDVLPNEPYDPHFDGQRLETTYFDTAAYDLRKARLTKGRYITLRIRCYDNGGPETYAISAKTESEKFRQFIEPGAAEAALNGMLDPASLLPPHLRARLTELGATDLVPVVTVNCTRYSVEDDQDRLTLDVHVSTDRHVCLPFGVLEFKSALGSDPPARIARMGLRPLKLSKFLWATEV
jgi:hypothetical protein